jgi:hypothetical protein
LLLLKLSVLRCLFGFSIGLVDLLLQKFLLSLLFLQPLDQLLQLLLIVVFLVLVVESCIVFKLILGHLLKSLDCLTDRLDVLHKHLPDVF